MREIKFRAWLPVDEWDEAGEKQAYEIVGPDDLAFEEYEPLSDLFKNCENLMQFTGLKDSKGNEIYEGDIVAVGERKDLTQCAYDKFGTPCLIGIEKPESHDFGDMEMNHKIFANRHMEVVGNIYEHSHLLKGLPK